MTDKRPLTAEEIEFLDDTRLGLGQFCAMVRMVTEVVDKPDRPNAKTREGELSYQLTRFTRSDRTLGLLSESTDGLLSDELSEYDKVVILEEAFTLATHLRRSDSGALSYLENKDTSQRFRKRFDGLTLLQAYTLSFGYLPDDILALNDDEIAGCFQFVAQRLPNQFPLAVVRRLVGLDVDDTLVSSLLAGSSEYEDDMSVGVAR